MQSLNESDRETIIENLKELDELLKQYNPNYSENVSIIVFWGFVGIASVAISLVFNELISIIAVCALVLSAMKWSKPASNDNKEIASAAYMIVQRCNLIFEYPESTLRHVGYTREYKEEIYREFVDHFPRYKNSNLKQVIKSCKLYN